MTGALPILRRHLRVFRRNWWSNLMFNFIEPFLYLAAMGFGLGAFVQQIEGMSYIQYIAPGMAASSAMWAATLECTYGSFVRLYYQKTFHAMLATPASIRDIVFGEALYGMVKSMLFGTVILTVIALLGLVQSSWALLIPFFLALPGMVFSLAALSYTGLAPHIDYFNYYLTLFITPMYLFSGIFFPVSSMPGWVQTVVWVNPLYHSVEVSRALVLGNPEPVLWLHAGWLAGVSALLVSLPIRYMKKRLIQ